MNWIIINNIEQLEEIKTKSFQTPQLIYKHSISCPTSSMTKYRLEKSEIPQGIDFYYLDLINYRAISNKIAEDYGVTHQSPQVLLIKNGICTFNKSHHAINMGSIETEAKR
ncbi:MAG: bacillithiol system redox-active protein YtxJ [Niabella sp.]